MSYSERIETPHESSDSAHPEPSDEIPSQRESQGDSLLPAEEVRHETSSGKETDSDSDSESDSESVSAGDSVSKSPVESAPPLKESAGLPPQESLPVSQIAQPNAEQASPPHGPISNLPLKENRKQNQASSSKIKNKQSIRKKDKPLKTLRNFGYRPIFRRWYWDEKTSIFPKILNDLGVKKDRKKIVKLLEYAAKVIDRDTDKDNFDYLLKIMYDSYCSEYPEPEKLQPTLKEFDHCLCSWAELVWPKALAIINPGVYIATLPSESDFY